MNASRLTFVWRASTRVDDAAVMSVVLEFARAARPSRASVLVVLDDGGLLAMVNRVGPCGRRVAATVHELDDLDVHRRRNTSSLFGFGKRPRERYKRRSVAECWFDGLNQ